MIKKEIIINEAKYIVSGYGQEMKDGTFQPVCCIAELQSDHAEDQIIQIGVFYKDQNEASIEAVNFGIQRLQNFQ